MDVIINIIKENWKGFLDGATTTMEVALLGTIFGSMIGLLIGVIRTIPAKKISYPKLRKKLSLAAPPKGGFWRGLPGFLWAFLGTAWFLFKRFLFKIVNFLLTAYIEVFRGTPMIIQSIVIFYGTAQLFDIHMTFEFAGIFIVSINTGAYMSEIVRGGINSIDRGQFEAAHAIGMSHGKTMFNIILPQTIRNILPATSNEFVINIKDTAVLNVIALSELFFKTKGIYGTNFKYYQTALIACAIYFVLTFTTTRILRFVEKRLRGSESYTVLGSRAKRREDMGVE